MNGNIPERGPERFYSRTRQASKTHEMRWTHHDDSTDLIGVNRHIAAGCDRSRVDVPGVGDDERPRMRIGPNRSRGQELLDQTPEALRVRRIEGAGDDRKTDVHITIVPVLSSTRGCP